MAKMGKYCKAYPTKRFQEFKNWPNTVSPAEKVEESYLFLQENLTVTDGIFLDEKVVFADITPEWEQFCRETLQFSIPPEIQEAAAA
jgi:hypothetical protein